MDHLKLKKFKSLLRYRISEIYFLKIKKENNVLEIEKNKQSINY